MENPPILNEDSVMYNGDTTKNSGELDLVDNEVPEYLAQVDGAKEALARYTLPLSKADKVVVMQGWNKVLAFRTAFSEALLNHWRLLVAERYAHHATDRDHRGKSTRIPSAIALIEANEDPIAVALGVRLPQAENLLVELLDGAVRSLCPHTQIVQREAYRPISDDIYLQIHKDGDLTTECETVDDYLHLLARCGVHPLYWVDFCESFAWALGTHTPYAQDDDHEDLDRGTDSAYRKAVAQLVALPGIAAYGNLKSLAHNELYKFHVKRFWRRHDETARLGVGETFYRTLLTKYPQLMDYFARTDMDVLAAHLMMTIDLLVKSVDDLGNPVGALRKGLNQLGRLHCRLTIPTCHYMLVGGTLLEVLRPLFELEEKMTANESKPVKADQLFGAFLRLYKEVMSLVYAPMLMQEKLVAEAKSFYRQIQEEFLWSDFTYDKRIMDVEEEISLTGTYTQTSEELEMGARLAWRNSAKCIGRISWNTLQVRDCRHISNPLDMCKEAEEHLKIATAGTNIQSVMTVFANKKPMEALGTRFWSAQLVRYAGYKQDDGSVLGDPANTELTEYLMERNYWDPPENKTAFDVLPLVVKSPGSDVPFVYQLPSEFVFEVNIEHPSKPEITALGLKWTTVPAISNFKMTLGGITYQDIPFNGWSVPSF